MGSIDAATELKRTGRFRQALSELDSGVAPRGEGVAAQLLRIELLERLGRYSQSLATATALIKSQGGGARERSSCEYVFGRIALERGDTEAGASLDEAIRAAVHASRAPAGTKFVLSYIEVETVDDPNVGAYKVIITPGS